MVDRPYCMYPWFHQKVESDGHARPCCAFRQDTNIKIPKDEFFASQFMVDLRRQMLSHDPPVGCRTCQKQELYGKYSQRDLSHELADKFAVTHTDLPRLISQEVDISNLCNVKCRTCDSYRSTRWAMDDRLINRRQHGLLESGWSLSESEAEITRSLVFLGGEPLLHQDRIIDALTRIEDRGRLGECEIFINTNCTVMFEERLLDLMSQTGRFMIGCSIDGYGALNEYIRTETKWTKVDTFVRNLSELSTIHDNVHFFIQTTFSIYNFNRLLDLLLWVDTLSSNPPVEVIFADQPSCISASLIPHKDRFSTIAAYQMAMIDNDKHKATLSQCLRFLNDAEDDSVNLPAFLSYNQKLDKIRTTSLSLANPQLNTTVSRAIQHGILTHK